MPSPLTLQDVRHSVTNFEPDFAPEAFKVPEDAQPTISLSFTSEEFREFWRHERQAYDWAHSSSGSERWYNLELHPQTPLPDKSKPEYLDPSRSGPPIRFDWSLKFRCRRYRKVSPGDINPNRVASQCPVYIRFRKIVGEDKIEVEYHWAHNHDTSPVSRCKLPLGPVHRGYVKDMVAKGHTWVTIRHKLRPSKEAMRQIEEGEASVPQGMFIPYRA
ncbi:hypothetical protein BGZ94_005209, partial [Podila epigama]